MRRERTLMRLAVVMTLLAGASMTASAQRQAAGRSAVELSFRPGLNQFGGGVNWTHWGYDGGHVLGLNVLSHTKGFTYHGYEKAGNSYAQKPGTYLDFDMDCTDVLASIGGIYRLFSTRSRSVILSVGATADAGVRIYGLFREVPAYPTAVDGSDDWAIPDGMNASPASLTAGGVNFVCGFSPFVQFEGFVSRSVSLCLRGVPRMQFMNAYGEGWFFPDLTLGVNIYL